MIWKRNDHTEKANQFFTQVLSAYHLYQNFEISAKSDITFRPYLLDAFDTYIDDQTHNVGFLYKKRYITKSDKKALLKILKIIKNSAVTFALKICSESAEESLGYME